MEKGEREDGVVLEKVYSLPSQSFQNVILSEQRERRRYPERPEGAKNLMQADLRG